MAEGAEPAQVNPDEEKWEMSRWVANVEKMSLKIQNYF